MKKKYIKGLFSGVVVGAVVLTTLVGQVSVLMLTSDGTAKTLLPVSELPYILSLIQ